MEYQLRKFRGPIICSGSYDEMYQKQNSTGASYEIWWWDGLLIENYEQPERVFFINGQGKWIPIRDAFKRLQLENCLLRNKLHNMGAKMEDIEPD